MLDNIKKEFSTRTLVLIPIAIAINIVMGELTTRLKVPIYLDSIGTVLVGAIAGPWAGALTGALASLIWWVSLMPMLRLSSMSRPRSGSWRGSQGRVGHLSKYSPAGFPPSSVPCSSFR